LKKSSGVSASASGTRSPAPATSSSGRAARPCRTSSAATPAQPASPSTHHAPPGAALLDETRRVLAVASITATSSTRGPSGEPPIHAVRPSSCPVASGSRAIPVSPAGTAHASAARPSTRASASTRNAPK
jgi:hypothetical protein